MTDTRHEPRVRSTGWLGVNMKRKNTSPVFSRKEIAEIFGLPEPKGPQRPFHEVLAEIFKIPIRRKNQKGDLGKSAQQSSGGRLPHADRRR